MSKTSWLKALALTSFLTLVGCGESTDDSSSSDTDGMGGAVDLDDSGSGGKTSGTMGKGSGGNASGTGGKETASGGTETGTGGIESTDPGICETNLPSGIQIQVLSDCDSDGGDGTIDVSEVDTPDAFNDLDDLDVVGTSVWIIVDSTGISGTIRIPVDPSAVDGDIIVYFIPEDGDPRFIGGTIENGQILVDITGTGTYTPVKLDPKVLPGCAGTEMSSSVTVAAASELTSLKGVHQIKGGLTIRATDLSNLDALECLRVVEGGLAIENATELTNTLGLRNLTIVGGGVSVYNNVNLADLVLPSLAKIATGLSLTYLSSIEKVDLHSLSTVNSSLVIANNGGDSDLTELDFSAITRIKGHLQLSSNGALEDLDGFASLARIDGNLDIQNNPRLDNTDGLAQLSLIEGGVNVYNHAKLTSLELPKLGDVPGGFSVTYNAALETVDVSSLPTVNSSLVIANNGGDSDLTELDFSAITRIKGHLQLSSNGALEDLDGFASLARIDGNLDIQNNPRLDNTDGLAQLSLIEGGVNVYNHAKLTSLELPKLGDVPGGFSVTYNAALETVDVSSLPTVNSSLVIANNGGDSNLTELDFSAITRIKGHLQLSSNGALEDLDGFASLARIDGNLDIQNNPRLDNTDGLAQLSLIEGGVNVYNHAKLTSLELPNLEELGANLSVQYNAQLPTCDPLAIRDALLGLTWTGTATVTNNLADLCSGT